MFFSERTAKRINVLDALQHPYLKEYHNPKHEPSCKSTFNFNFEARATSKVAIQSMMLDEIKLFEESIGTEAPNQCNDTKDASEQDLFSPGVMTGARLIDAEEEELTH